MEKQNYDFFLFENLIKESGLIANLVDLEYDYQFEMLESLYDEYDNSRFNSDKKGAYDCIKDFIDHKLREKEKKSYQQYIIHLFIANYTSDPRESAIMRTSAHDYVHSEVDFHLIKDKFK